MDANLRSPVALSMEETAGSADAVLLEEGDKLVDAEVGEDFAVPVHGRGLGLAGELDHFAHGGGVAGDVAGRPGGG